ncbi:MAG: pyridoxal-phosphate dependent enzyme [Acidobacteria bacterium]|nr:pyridoxal-phosphate dependent enzyme [Acidobacteriota bacterium]
MPDFAKRLEAIERVRLANLPTPLDEAPRLAAHAGLARLLVKRDDTTGLALGGNKARKLEYELATLARGGCDVIVTIGGTQSNHAAMTAAAARRLGVDVKLVLGGPDFERFTGNLLLDVLYGAEIRYLVDDDANDALAAAMDEWVLELRRAGRRPLALPIGGSTGLGALGYVRATRELAAQLGEGPVQIVTAVGSCGTLAGLIVGARLFLPRARVVGVSASRASGAIAARTVEIARECAEILGADLAVGAGDVEAHDAYAGEYGVPTPAGLEAIHAAARLEGLLLDPCYTGKAMSGLFDLARRGVLDAAIPTVFLHTGGAPIAFSDESLFASQAICTKVR